MQPLIKTIPPKKLIGKNLSMSFANNKTAELWRSFMPLKKTISNTIGSNLYSLQLYDPSYFTEFNPHKEFEKWALAEVTNFDNIPEGMKAFTLAGGLYAVFQYKGSSTDTGIFEYIFGTWLPSSPYLLDQRPHFEVLGENYKNADPDSEEEIWIPVKPK